MVSASHRTLKIWDEKRIGRAVLLGVLHEVAAGAELEVVAIRGGGGGDLAELAALDVGHVA